MKHFNRVCVIVYTLCSWLPWSGKFSDTLYCVPIFSYKRKKEKKMHFQTFPFLEVILIYSLCVLVGCCVPWSVFLVGVRLFRTQFEQKVLGVVLLHLFIVCRECAHFTHYMLTVYFECKSTAVNCMHWVLDYHTPVNDKATWISYCLPSFQILKKEEKKLPAEIRSCTHSKFVQHKLCQIVL